MNRSPNSLKIVFFGTPKIAAEVLENLAKSEFKPQLAVTGVDEKTGRGRKLTETPVKTVAKNNKIKTLQPSNLDDGDFIKELKEFAPDVAVLVAYGEIIPDEVLQIPKFGFLNIHPSLLPKYRGPSPIVTAILNGDKITGATVIVLDSELDHGPQITQREVEIANTDTHDSLATKLSSAGSKILIEILPDYLSQNVTPEIQNHDTATYTEKITKASGKIDLTNPPDIETLDRMIRAYFPWPAVWTELELKSERVKELKKIRLKFLPNTPTILPSYNPTDLFLVQPEGKRPMTPKEFLNGYPMAKEKLEKIMTG